MAGADELRVERISTYLLTGAQALDSDYATLTPAGLAGDRAYVAYDPETFQRVSSKPNECPRLMRIRPVRGELRPVLVFYDEEGRAESEYDMSSLHRYPSQGQPVTVYEFEEPTPCHDMGDEPAEVLSEFLRRSVRLAIKSKDWLEARAGTTPPAERKNAPLHVVSAASMLAVQEVLGTDEDLARRFRPGLVIGGEGYPDIEQSWRRLRIGRAVIRNLRPTTRCSVPGLNPVTGGNIGDIPKLYRGFPKAPDSKGRVKPVKGIYAALESDSSFEIHVGDLVEMLE